MQGRRRAEFLFWLGRPTDFPLTSESSRLPLRQNRYKYTYTHTSLIDPEDQTQPCPPTSHPLVGLSLARPSLARPGAELLLLHLPQHIHSAAGSVQCRPAAPRPLSQPQLPCPLPQQPLVRRPTIASHCDDPPLGCPPEQAKSSRPWV